VTDHPIKYSVVDFAVVFSAKGADAPQLFMRKFKVDPNTFYSGLESVGSATFGAINNNNNNNNGSSGGNYNNNNNNNSSGSGSSGAVVGVVNAFSGEGGLRTSGNNQYGGNYGGNNNNQNGAVANLGNNTGSTGGGGGGSIGGGGGLRNVTTVNPASDVSLAARAFFTTLGVNLENPPGKSVFFNDRSGELFVKATSEDLDTIERAIQILNEVAPQVHIKSRFIEVQQNDNKALGFDWYLGQVNMGNSVVGQGGNPGSLTVPTSAANPLGAFPGATAANTIGDTGQELFSSGLASGSGSATATITGILTNPNFQVVIHALQQRQGFESLAEPEITTTSGRQTQIRATQIITVITGVNYEQGTAASIGNGTTGTTTQ
jgi:type II secretory pathway component GspD/PulD (secretin)